MRKFISKQMTLALVNKQALAVEMKILNIMLISREKDGIRINKRAIKKGGLW